MPGVSTQHKQYAGMLLKWRRCRDAASGEDAVHMGRESYLPKLKEQEQADYDAYVQRAPWFNATWRTIEGLRGMILRLPPKLELPKVAQDIADTNIDGAGTPLASLLPEIVEEALKIGRLGLFIDYPSVNLKKMTQADAQRENLQPRMISYRAEQIINWATQPINNKKQLTLVVLEEEAVTQKSQFEQSCQKQWRALSLESTALGWIYFVRVWQKNEKDEDVIIDEFCPQMAGKPLTEIPFYFIDTDDCGPDCDDPPLIDLVNMNMSHYRTGADHEHGCHFTALPTAWVSGYKKEDGEKLYLGSQSAWIFSDPQAKAGFLEFTGAGLESLAKNLDRKEKHMAVLGARMLEEQKRGVETAEAAGIHRSGEQSMLGALAWSVSFGLKRALQMFSNWAGGQQEVNCELNRNFFPTPMTFQELTALVGAWQQGAISFETLFTNLQQGDIVDQGLTSEEEQQRISDQMPLVPAASAAKDKAKPAPEGAPAPEQKGAKEGAAA